MGAVCNNGPFIINFNRLRPYSKVVSSYFRNCNLSHIVNDFMRLNPHFERIFVWDLMGNNRPNEMSRDLLECTKFHYIKHKCKLFMGLKLYSVGTFVWELGEIMD